VSLDLLIVGAGPAGVSAALWAHTLELDVLLLDGAPGPGGQLHAVHFHPHDVPGFEHGDGAELAGVYARQLAAANVPLRSGAIASALEPAPGEGAAAAVRLASGERLEALAVLVATGVRRRRLDVPGERELEGRGVSYSGTRDRERFAGGRVLVVGGGDAAYENALLLAAAGCDVTLLVRGGPRARAEFRARVAAEPRITVRTGARVLAVLGDETVRGAQVEDAAGAGECAADAIVVKVGVVPNSEWCAGALALDPEGYVQVDSRLATSARRVWAAGDVTRPVPPSIPVAVGQGAQAASMVRAALRGS
jgi:thioredoxin reductase (NADPH)